MHLKWTTFHTVFYPCFNSQFFFSIPLLVMLVWYNLLLELFVFVWTWIFLFHCLRAWWRNVKTFKNKLCVTNWSFSCFKQTLTVLNKKSVTRKNSLFLVSCAKCNLIKSHDCESLTALHRWNNNKLSSFCDTSCQGTSRMFTKIAPNLYASISVKCLTYLQVRASCHWKLWKLICSRQGSVKPVIERCYWKVSLQKNSQWQCTFHVRLLEKFSMY
jgi:hypothetical protein